MEKQANVRQRTVTINNFQLAYSDVGEGEIPILCLHGFPFDKSTWELQQEYFQSSQRIIACDIRGFGHSTDETTLLSIEIFTDDLQAFMDKLNIKKAILCGLSMGGFIALNAVRRFPERFEALILCDTMCIADTAEVKSNRFQTIDNITLNGPVDFNEAFIKSVFHPESLTEKLDVVGDLRSIVYRNSINILSQGLVALAGRTETCSMLNEINMPTLIICGRADEVTPLFQSEFMQKRISGAVLKVIEDAGHVSNLEQPAIFNQHLADFLAGLSGQELADVFQKKSQ